MNLFFIHLSYAFKKKRCIKRVQKRELAKYNECVQQIIQNGFTESNGQTFKSVADLTIAFYCTSKCSITSNYFANKSFTP